jgi:hypothetical protein
MATLPELELEHFEEFAVIILSAATTTIPSFL